MSLIQVRTWQVFKYLLLDLVGHMCLVYILTMHLVAFNELAVFFQSFGRSFNMSFDVIIQKPRLIFIKDHEEQSELLDFFL